MSEKIKTELETILEQEKMLFPVACKIAEAFCYKGKIRFDNEYRYITYTEDLQNIQALPYTLSRVSSLTVDNTIYPIIEYYTCTEREKEAFANKIAYNSMTVMIIGKILLSLLQHVGSTSHTRDLI